MTIVLNGEAISVAGTLTVAGLLDLQGLPRTGIAVERNREIVPKSAYEAEMLAEGDRVEIVQFVGGG